MEILAFLIISLIALLVIMYFLKRPDNTNGNSTQHPKNDYTHLYGPQTSDSTAGSVPAAETPQTAQIPAQASTQAPAVQHPAAPAMPPQPPKPAAPKKPFSPIPLLLAAGVSFLFLGGIIFLTSTWNMLPDVARAISLLSASVLAFSINVVAERVLKLPKTGLAFYILGCIFLPLALGGIGAFSLLGSWFSFHGEGAALLMAVIFLSAAATSFLGQKNYRNPFLAWLTLTGLSGAGTSLAFFLSDMLGFSEPIADAAHGALTVGIVQTVMTIAFTIAGEYYLSHHEPNATPFAKVWTLFLFQQDLVTLFLLLIAGSDAPIAACILSLLTAALCLNQRFIHSGIHGGMFLFCGGILASLNSLCLSAFAESASGLEHFVFIVGGTLMLMLAIASVSKLRAETQKTAGILGWILAIPLLPCAVICMILETEHTGAFFLFLFLPLVFSLFHLLSLPRNPFAKDSPHSLLMAILLFCFTLMESAQDVPLLRILLVFGALILLVQYFFSRRLWPLVLSICTCIALPLMELPHPSLWLTWLCTAVMASGLVYAYLTRRGLLERAFALAGIPFLLISSCQTFLLFAESTESWILTMAVLTLVSLAEFIFFWKQERSRDIRTFCKNLSIFLAAIVVIGVIADSLDLGWYLLFAGITGVFAAANLKRNVNIAAFPMMIIFFLACNQITEALGRTAALRDGQIIGLQLGCCLLMLLIFAGMGRLLLPGGFYHNADGRLQVDFGLLAAALPIFTASGAIDWYPSIVSCLLLSVYSLMYLGRTKTHYIPTLLAAAFGCLTIFFHNIHDPFRILEIWHRADFKAPQILLFLLPMHLFILTMLWILPKKYKENVHMARFVMYCITMLCILTASLSFGRAEDGIILAVFSFLIMAGSFFVKRLRWFTLGFSVLFLMTLKLTWNFWRSLHWGIYLFLAGAVLIGIAFYYEYAIRRADEKNKPALPAEHAEGEETPDEPKEKIKLFKEWNW